MTEFFPREPHYRTFRLPEPAGDLSFWADEQGVVAITEESLAVLFQHLGIEEVTDDGR